MSVVQHQLENLFLSVFQKIVRQEKDIQIQLPNRNCFDLETISEDLWDDSKVIELERKFFGEEQPTQKLVTIDLRKSRSTKKFSFVVNCNFSSTILNFFFLVCIIKIIGVCLELIRHQKFATKRDVYYLDTELFSTQQTVDEIVDDLSCLLQIPRRYLHIHASYRGVISGYISFKEVIGCANFPHYQQSNSFVSSQFVSINGLHYSSISTPGKFISPLIENIIDINLSQAKYILVVEKDAIFMRLLEEEYILKQQCVLVTSKGYPDLATRQLLHTISVNFPNLPIYMVTDADPYGIEIAMCYYFGVLKSMSNYVEELSCPTLKWIGIQLSSIVNLLPENCFLPFSQKEVTKSRAICKYLDAMLLQHSQYKSQIDIWKANLQFMEEQNKRAEIESLNAISLTYFTEVYLPQLCVERKNNSK